MENQITNSIAQTISAIVIIVFGTVFNSFWKKKAAKEKPAMFPPNNRMGPYKKAKASIFLSILFFIGVGSSVVGLWNLMHATGPVTRPEIFFIAYNFASIVFMIVFYELCSIVRSHTRQTELIRDVIALIEKSSPPPKT